MLKTIRRFTNDHYKGCDYRDDIWLKILSNIDKANDGNFYNWMIKITFNYCISQVRKQSRVKIYPINFDIPDYNDSKEELIQAIVAEINNLPIKYQEVLILRLHRFKFKKISSILRVPPGTILQRYRDGILKLRNLLIEKDVINFVLHEKNCRKIY